MAAAAMEPAAPVTRLFAELPPLELQGVSWEGFQEQQQSASSLLTLKDYLWKHCQDQILRNMTVSEASSSSPPPPQADPYKKTLGASDIVNKNGSNNGIHSSSNSCNNNTVKDADPASIMPGVRLEEILALPSQNINHVSNVSNMDLVQNKAAPEPAASTGVSAGKPVVAKPGPSQHLEWMQADLSSAARKLKLLEKLADVQRQYLDLQGPNEVFRGLLATLLDIMDAEYGFVAEVRYKPNDGNEKRPEDRYMQTLAVTDIAWDASSRAFVRDNIDRGLAFYNLDSLFGHVMTSEKAVVSNSPSTDSRSAGLPKGHPPMQAFLGVPFFNANDGTINGLVGLANKPGGFRQVDVDFLEPCVRICGNLLQAYQNWTPHIHRQPPRIVGGDQEDEEHQSSSSPSQTTTKDSMGSLSSQNNKSSCVPGRRHSTPESMAQLQQHVSCCSHAEESVHEDEHDLVDVSYRHQDQRIHELELANIQLAQAHQQVVRQSAAQLQHFACSSHEIRTPLNCIIGLSSLLATTELNPMQAESMQLISSSSELLLQVVNDVLDYSKLESGHVDVKIQPSNMQETLLGVVQALELKTRDKNIRVRTKYSPFLPPTWSTDRLRLQQILFNLLGNAFKFSEADTCIDLKVELGPPGRPSVASHAQPLTSQCVLRFIVKDCGCGIQPHQLENIFKPFVQAGDDTKTMYEGTGLGLAITTRLVKALGGCVYANSTVNVGSEFVVEFPYEGETFDVEAMGKQFAKTTVLVVPGQHMPVDRIPVMRQMLESYHVNYRILESMEDMDRIELSLHPEASMTDASKTSMEESTNSKSPAIHLPSDHEYVFLVDESVYKRDVMERFKERPVARALLTFGPDYTVAETSYHFRDLMQIVPSVLMQSLLDELDQARPAPSTSATTPTDLRKNGPVSNGQRKRRLTRASTSIKEEVSILAAEDNAINRKVLKALLKKLGYTNVSFVTNGKLAVEAVEREKYDVVLMDVQMPVMDGIEATRLIGERQKEMMALEGSSYVGPKVVFVTATVDQALEEKAKKLGAMGFVPKPFNLKQLESCMTDICRSLA